MDNQMNPVYQVIIAIIVMILFSQIITILANFFQFSQDNFFYYQLWMWLLIILYFILPKKTL